MLFVGFCSCSCSYRRRSYDHLRLKLTDYRDHHFIFTRHDQFFFLNRKLTAGFGLRKYVTKLKRKCFEVTGMHRKRGSGLSPRGFNYARVCQNHSHDAASCQLRDAEYGNIIVWLILTTSHFAKTLYTYLDNMIIIFILYIYILKRQVHLLSYLI